MDIRSIYLAHLNKPPYSFVTSPGGGLVCRVTESEAAPYNLNWFDDPKQPLISSFDVHRVLPFNGADHLFVVGDHQLKRRAIDAPWITTSVQDYVSNNYGGSGCPMFPIDLNPGDAGEISSVGRWSWVEYDDVENIIATGAGDWSYTSRYSLMFGRLHWEEIYSETHDETGITTPYHKVHQYDASGWLGFIDRLTSLYAVRQ